MKRSAIAKVTGWGLGAFVPVHSLRFPFVPPRSSSTSSPGVSAANHDPFLHCGAFGLDARYLLQSPTVLQNLASISPVTELSPPVVGVTGNHGSTTIECRQLSRYGPSQLEEWPRTAGDLPTRLLESLRFQNPNSHRQATSDLFSAPAPRVSPLMALFL